MSDDITQKLRVTMPDFKGLEISCPCRIRSLLMKDAADEIEKLTRERDEARAEVARLRDEDTKTRHALRGWVWVCPDGGDEPTHERVSAVVAEVERLREVIRTIRARCVEMDDSDAVSETLDISSAALEDEP